MTLTLELPTETEKRLHAKAGAKGLTVKSYLEELVRYDLENPNGGLQKSELGDTSADEWIAEHRALAKRHEHIAYYVDDSRESIYAGRGE